MKAEELRATMATAQSRAHMKVVQEDIDRFELKLGLRPYSTELLERPPYEVRLQEQVNGYLSLGEKPPPNLVAATRCAKLFPKAAAPTGSTGGGGRDTISPGVAPSGRRVDGKDLASTSPPTAPAAVARAAEIGSAGTGATPRAASASIARSRHRLRHKESVFSTVGRGGRRHVAEWADHELGIREASAHAAAAAAGGGGSRRPWVSPISMGGHPGMASGGGGGGGGHPSWFDDDDGEDVGGAAGAHPERRELSVNGGSARRTRPLSAAFQREPQLLSRSMHPEGRAQWARARHDAAFLIPAREGGDFGDPPAGFSKIQQQRDDAVARRAAREALAAARDAAATTARIGTQRLAFRDRVAEGTLHKAILGDPFTVRRISEAQRAAGKVRAREELTRRVGVVPPVDTVAAAAARAYYAGGGGTGTGTGFESGTGTGFESGTGTATGNFGAFDSRGGGGRGGGGGGRGTGASSTRTNAVTPREAQAIADALAALDDFDAKPLPKMPENAPMVFRIT